MEDSDLLRVGYVFPLEPVRWTFLRQFLLLVLPCDHLHNNYLQPEPKKGQPDVVELLLREDNCFPSLRFRGLVVKLDRGADANAKTDDSLTALKIAEKKGYTEIARLIRTARVKE